jgi:hypothetical protein
MVSQKIQQKDALIIDQIIIMIENIENGDTEIESESKKDCILSNLYEAKEELKTKFEKKYGHSWDDYDWTMDYGAEVWASELIEYLP